MGSDLATSKKDLQKPRLVLTLSNFFIWTLWSPDFGVSVIALVSNDATEVSVLYLLQRGHHFKCTCIYLIVSNGLLLRSPEFAQLFFVFPKVCLAADQYEWDASAEVIHFRIPLMVENQNFYIWLFFFPLTSKQ